MKFLFSTTIATLLLASISGCNQTNQKKIKFRFKMLPAYDNAQYQARILTPAGTLDYNLSNANQTLETSDYVANKGDNLSYQVLISTVTCRNVTVEVLEDGVVKETKNLSMGSLAIPPYLPGCTHGTNQSFNYAVD